MSIYHIGSVKPKEASGLVKEVYQELKQEMGDVVEPVSLHALEPTVLREVWGMLREILLIDDHMLRREKEAVAAAVSSSNACPYCVDAHTIMVMGLDDAQTAKAIAKKDLSLITDSPLRGLLEWAFHTRDFDQLRPVENKYLGKALPELIGTVVFFHYLNRMVTLFLGATILPMNVPMMKGMMKKMAAMMFSKVLKTKKEGRTLADGETLDLFQQYPMHWANSNTRVHYALAKAQQTTQALAKDYLPEEIRSFVVSQIQAWDGQDLESTREMEAALLKVEEEYRDVARVLLHTAMCDYRVQGKDIQLLKEHFGGKDEAALVLTSWVSMVAAIEIGNRLGDRMAEGVPVA
ncbi:MAG TPA: hypothetical protein DCE41_34455 [Cytophagales bacterium]|nr:hypothetical protein [Cytophagales bacterium]HAA17534.1 hypothetical protein [Cytophagales bacterium]HAP59438.1 hypothetical protein [Cytophagales bacterium]